MSNSDDARKGLRSASTEQDDRALASKIVGVVVVAAALAILFLWSAPPWSFRSSSFDELSLRQKHGEQLDAKLYLLEQHIRLRFKDAFDEVKFVELVEAMKVTCVIGSVTRIEMKSQLEAPPPVKEGTQAERLRAFYCRDYSETISWFGYANTQRTMRVFVDFQSNLVAVEFRKNIVK